ncbi:MAG: MBL fold metallo-hydrolase [Myxococcota bacterium]|nr:MBL fold metallo-hydrolase [Myxococcota bacterium]
MIALPSWLIPLKLPMPATLGTINSYLIQGPKGNALVDTGMSDAVSRKSLIKQLKDLGLALSDIDTVVCTHHHADHAGLGQTFLDAGAQVLMSGTDAASLKQYLAHPELDEKHAVFFGKHAVPDEFIEKVVPVSSFFRNLQEPFEPSATLEEGQKLDLGGIPFTVWVTPGHTPGHICLKHERALILTGDCVTRRDATHISMRIEVVGTDPLDGFLKSLRRLGDLDNIPALSGHGSPISDISRRIESIIGHHLARLGQVEQALQDAARSAYDISLDTLGERPQTFAKWLAMSQTMAYLEHLIQLGKAEEIPIASGLGYRKRGDST